jgi:subtilase family serine protease
MRRSLTAVLVTAAAVVAATMALAPDAGAAPSTQGVAQRATKVCTERGPDRIGCFAVRRDTVDSAGEVVTPFTASYSGGLRAADIQSAYKLSGLSSSGRTVAIVDAYDAPNAEDDLAVYRSEMGLPACPSGNGCFTKVNQTGGTVPPAVDPGWAQEISLDLDMVSAACPDCKILLVEANSASFADLGAAVNYAASVPGVVAISNSYGSSSDTSQLAAYDHPGIAVTASTGDSGYGVSAPASFKTVVAVGGTSLKAAPGTNRGWTEAAWSGAGSGCSTRNAKPTWQPTSVTKCNGKANADVSAVADPATGVAVYDSTDDQGTSGWMVFGGTSASSPIIAAVYALSGKTDAYPAQYAWSSRGALFDVSGGSNGRCTTKVWCTSGSGWDGPTGLGTPNGTGAF